MSILPTGGGAEGTLRPISRLGDVTTGHGCHQPVIGADASPTVQVNGLPIHIVTNKTVPHTCGTDVHPDVMTVGSLTVKANGQSVMRLGDTMVPGGAMAEACINVFAKS